MKQMHCIWNFSKFGVSSVKLNKGEDSLMKHIKCKKFTTITRKRRWVEQEAVLRNVTDTPLDLQSKAPPPTFSVCLFCVWIELITWIHNPQSNHYSVLLKSPNSRNVKYNKSVNCWLPGTLMQNTFVINLFSTTMFRELMLSYDWAVSNPDLKRFFGRNDFSTAITTLYFVCSLAAWNTKWIVRHRKGRLCRKIIQLHADFSIPRS